jgi:hypothetical protein
MRLSGDMSYLHVLPRDFLAKDMEGRFTYLAKSHHWDGSGESASGHGSTLEKTTEYRQELATLVQEHGFRSMFDAPCGDLNWMRSVLEDLDLQYRGGDIVKTLIERNQMAYPKYQFSHFDITKDEFPEADVWHCRDCLFHLSYQDISKAFANFQRSTIRYALITSDQGKFKNKNIETGDFRYLDLLAPPFSFPEPERWLRDRVDGVSFRRVGLWDRQAITQATRDLDMLVS